MVIDTIGRMAMIERRVSGGGLSGWALYLKVTWVLLVLLAVFPILAPIADLVGIAMNGIPSDHVPAFASISGSSWSGVKASSSGVAGFISQLETEYALHELVFGILFLMIVAVPFRRGERWAWFACWAVLIADIGYSLTLARHDAVLLRQSLIAVISLPVLLLVQAPRFFRRRPPA
jgi:hypothetical protein